MSYKGEGDSLNNRIISTGLVVIFCATLMLLAQSNTNYGYGVLAGLLIAVLGLKKKQ